MNSNLVARRLVKSIPILEAPLKSLKHGHELLRFAGQGLMPNAIKAKTEQITMAITAYCNLRCKGCRYGRDFMPGSQMSLEMALRVIDDAAHGGVQTMRLYGGEPLLHPDLPRMIERCIERGIHPYVTTNGIALGNQAEKLYAAGLRSITIGYYGQDETYDTYVQRPGRFAKLIESLEAVRAKLPADFELQLNYLLMKGSSTPKDMQEGWDLAKRFDMTFRVDLVHYSLPYFTQGLQQPIQFDASDTQDIEDVTQLMLQLKREEPARFRESAAAIASIPDWLAKGPEMDIPCDAGKLIWIGADGTVQLCYAAFPLGNLHDKPLSEILFSQAHHAAASGAYQLNCPKCHCERNCRVNKHLPSLLHYQKIAKSAASSFAGTSAPIA